MLKIENIENFNLDDTVTCGQIFRYTSLDDGSYTITASDLEHYPDNATLSFYIGRASFTITNDGNPNNDLSVGAYTVVRSDFKIDK